MRFRLLSALALIGTAGAVWAGFSQAGAPRPTTVTGVSWRLVSGIDVRGWKAFAPSLHFENRRLGGSSGCNYYSARYKLEGEKLRLGRLGTTLMACDEPERLVEGAFHRALERVAGLRVERGVLMLLDAEGGVVLRFKAARPVGTWVVGFLGDRDMVSSLPDDVEITVRFSGGRITGTSGCNTYRTTYAADLERMRIRKPVGTRKQCDRPAGVMELERRFLRQLPTTATYTIDGSLMRLARASGTTVAFLERED